MMATSIRRCALLLMVLCGGIRPAHAVGTAFTYQGQLRQSGVAQNGTCDLLFTLFDAFEEGDPVGSPVSKEEVPLANGLFTVELDFGPVFTGPDRWLEVAARCPGGIGDLTALAPRQPLTAVPYAQFASSVPSGSITADRIAPGTMLPPSGPAGGSLAGTYPDPSLAPDSVGFEELAADRSSMEKVSEGVITIDANDNVGVGTTTPQARLDTLGGGAIAVMGTSSSRGLVGRLGDISCSGLFGVGGCAGSTSGTGVFGSSANGPGVSGLSTAYHGVEGYSTSGIGVIGRGTTRGVVGALGIGTSCAGTYAVGGCAGTGSGIGVLGSADAGPGVRGVSNVGRAVEGLSTSGIGVIGDSTSRGVIGTLGGTSCAGTYAVGGCAGIVSADGVQGRSINGAGVRAIVTDVTGNIFVGMFNGNQARINSQGRGYFNGGTQTGGADFAESLPASDDPAALEPGDVLEMDPQRASAVRRSRGPQSLLVAGVYSTKPAVLAVGHHGVDDTLDGEVPVGIVGVLPTKVTDENGPIVIGDLLVTASRPGHAMKARPAMVDGVPIYPTGAILGKALAPLPEGAGVIEVLVTLR